MLGKITSTTSISHGNRESVLKKKLMYLSAKIVKVSIGFNVDLFLAFFCLPKVSIKLFSKL